jgi:type II secretory pathway pseudopilin PulG
MAVNVQITCRRREGGYVLLTLLLAMAVLIIAAGVAASSIAFTIRRDREEELIHRGVQYKRAIREFAKKTGRFPLRMEELDNTNGMRFLRKHYKDPITGQDFKLVYMADIQFLSSAPGLPGITANAAAGSNADKTSSNNTDDPQAQADSNGDPQPNRTPNSTGQANQQGIGGAPAPSNSGQPLSRGLIVGVVSASKEQTIRQFSSKNHYNQWRFYYDPSFDQYFLMNAPTERPFFQPPPKLDDGQPPTRFASPPAQQSPQPQNQ